ncbi:MAG: OmpA family protein [Tenuifilaceae bacterium]|jgi:outer membrane protein OmpA-like peptidoglycan-associated protein|nr:OmpA family protein [Tenuifilaceae bacterium]
MRYFFISLIFGVAGLALFGQEITTHPPQLFVDSLGQVYTRADAPAYLFLAPAEDQDKFVLAPSSDQAANPMYWDGHGSHYITHKDQKTNTNIRFRILADGFAPKTSIQFENGLIFYLNNMYFVESGAVAKAITKDDMSGVSQVYISINEGTFSPLNEAKTFAHEGEYKVQIYAVDNVGNAEQPKEYKVTTTTEAAVKMDNIYFETNSATLSSRSYPELNTLVKILKEFPNVNLEIRAHTDSWGNPKYNLLLSERRAQAAVDYLVARGVSKSRLTAKGFGETQLVNECAKGVVCPAQKHAENRRVEFVISQVDDQN